ncbi:MAG: hypothetical protein Q4E12_04900 [Coriobacteriia bacterium]|nr:hypothetical protein [Coriobacteriia bacterium]
MSEEERPRKGGPTKGNNAKGGGFKKRGGSQGAKGSSGKGGFKGKGKGGGGYRGKKSASEEGSSGRGRSDYKRRSNSKYASEERSGNQEGRKPFRKDSKFGGKQRSEKRDGHPKGSKGSYGKDARGADKRLDAKGADDTKKKNLTRSAEVRDEVSAAAQRRGDRYLSPKSQLKSKKERDRAQLEREDTFKYAGDHVMSRRATEGIFLEIGEPVKHAQYGAGVVRKVSNGKVGVEFADQYRWFAFPKCIENATLIRAGEQE